MKINTAQAPRESQPKAGDEAGGAGQVQPQERQGVSPQGGVPIVLDVHLSGLGGKVSGAMGDQSSSLKDRADEEGGPKHPQTQGLDPELVQGKKTVLIGGRGGPEHQSKSHHEKIIRLQDIQIHQNRLVSLSWQASGASGNPQFFLRRQKF